MTSFIHRAARIADRIAMRAGVLMVLYARGDVSIELPALPSGKENDRDWQIDAAELGNFGRPQMGDTITIGDAEYLVFRKDLDGPPWRWHDQVRSRLRIHSVSRDEGLGFRQVTVEAKTETTAASGQKTASWATHGTFPAVIRSKDGETRWDRDTQNRATVDWQLVLPSTDISRAITPQMRVLVEGKTFNLGAAYRHNMADHYVVLEAREVVA